jgi:catechol 2,3-dioxygenase-like lactoylglutathione lyase family enzyme
LSRRRGEPANLRGEGRVDAGPSLEPTEGRGSIDDFALHTAGTKPGRDRATTGAHIAFVAPDADAVARWHDAALSHGAEDNGAPGMRPEYSGNYYAAFVLDPDGNNVEAVFHTAR